MERAFGRSSAAAKGFSHNVGLSVGTLLKSALVIGVFEKAVEGLRATLHAGIEEFSTQAKVAAQTGAALKSTGGIAGVTAKHIDDLALRLDNLSGVNHNVVQSGENVLLSFTKIRNQAGKGNDIFDQAAKAALNFSVRTGKDVPVAALALGKALEDPANKLKGLAKVGVIFTAGQGKLVKALVASGHALDAQKLILAEFTKRVGGAAKAAGETLPGQLKVLRNRFADLAASGIGLIAPTLSRAVGGLTGFVRKLSEIQGGKAKLSFAFTGIEGLGNRLFNLLRREVAAVAARIPDALQLISRGFASLDSRVQKAFRAIDWAAAGRTILTGVGVAGRFVGQAVSGLLTRITDALQHVDFQKVGKALVDGFALAVVAVGNFLLHVDWGAVIGASLRLAVTVIKGFGSLLFGAGKELGSLLLKGLGAGIRALAGFVEKEALKVTLAIVNALNFKVFGRSVIPGLSALAGAIKGKLASIQGSIDKLHGKTVTVDVKTTLNGKSNEAPLDLGQVALARAAATKKAKPLDTSLGLTDAAGNAKKAADTATKALQRLLDILNLAVSKATLTKTFKDDLAANQALIGALREQIRLHKDDLSLQQDLVSAQQARVALVQQQKDAERAARNAKQFRSLGLDETGQALVPLKKGLARQLAKVTADITGSFLDTGKTQKVLAAIRKLVLNPFTKVSKDVRSTVKQMLDDLEQQLKSRTGSQTKFHKVSANAILSGLGLSADQIRALRGRLAQVGAGGTIPTRGAGAFGIGIPVSVGGRGDVVVPLTVTLDGKVIAQSTTRHQQRKGRGTVSQRRGRNPGMGLGLA